VLRSLPIALVGLLALPAAAPEVPAQIDEATTWPAVEGPYTVVEDATVAEGVTLTVEPGVLVELYEGRSLFVEGALVAAGTDADPVVFTGADTVDGAARWASLVFRDSAEDAVFEGVGEYASGSLLQRCVFEHATSAVQTESASPYIHACTFRDNHNAEPADTVGAAALYVGPGSDLRVRDCTFERNVVDGTAWGGAVYVDTAVAILQDNTFVDNVGPYGGALTTAQVYSPIVGNHFEGNATDWEGGAASFYSSSPSFLDNTVVGNSSLKDGGGIHVCIDCRPHAAPFFLDNVITDNTNAALGAGGIGAAYIRVCRDNALHGNTNDGDPNEFGWFNDHLDVFPEWVTHPEVAGNWWGTTDTGDIADAITDGDDQDGYGTVTFEPVLDGPPGDAIPRVTITTRKLMYWADGETMDVYLTLYNPDEAIDVELWLWLQLGDGPRLPYTGDLGYPDAVVDGSVHRLTMPADSVWFGNPLSPEFTTASLEGHATWHAALFDASTGEPIGDVISAHLELGREEVAE